MQRDLLELRDAHAKLRTTNEKLRREKELIRQNIRQNPFENEQKNINYILDLVSQCKYFFLFQILKFYNCTNFKF